MNRHLTTPEKVLGIVKKAWMCFSFALIAPLLIVSCSTDVDPEETLPGDVTAKTISFTSKIVSTKLSTGTSLSSKFDTGDEIGVFAVLRTDPLVQAYPSENPEENYMHNVKYRLTESGFIWVADEDQYYPLNDATMDIYAYYPYSSDQNSAIIAYDGKENNVDLLSAVALSRKASTAGVSIELMFSHKLALVQVELTNIADPAEYTVTMLNTVADATVDITGEQGVEPGENTDNIDMNSEIGLFRAYVPAQSFEAGTRLFRISNGTTEYYYNIAKDVELNTGSVKKYQISIGISKSSLPNTYIIPEGGTLSFPVKKAFNMWRNHEVLSTVGSSLDGTMTAEVAWQDVKGLITDDNISLVGNDDSAEITLTADETKGSGNAVVSLKIDGEIFWSWHIWVTDFNPNDPANQKILNGRIWMDRNLGATTLEYLNPDSYGQLYQWGRNTPIANTDDLENLVPDPYGDIIHYNRSVWDGKGNKVEFVDIDLTESTKDNLLNALRNPNAIIPYYQYQDAEEKWIVHGDWYSWNRNEGNDKWLQADGSKGLFDPCPEGWRVPVSGQGTNSAWAGMEKVWDYDKEVQDSGAAGEYQPSGTISKANLIRWAGGSGYYWSATGEADRARALEIGKFSPLLLDKLALKSTGYAVRCVKE